MSLTMSKSSRLPAYSEQELVGAIRAGDDRAFEELYARYRERIFAFILSKVHDHGRAEDIAQEVFMSALRRLRSSDQTIAFKPWIYEIAKNACIDEFRRGSRAREVPLESDGEFVVDRQTSSLSRVPTPAAAVESKQQLNDLRGAFGGLSTTHHHMLVMREFEGMSYDEIGERLGHDPSDGREQPVPRPPQAHRGVPGAGQRPALRADPDARSTADGCAPSAGWGSVTAGASRGISPTASPVATPP